MTNNKWLLSLAALVLLALNVWRWWPASDMAEATTVNEITIASSDRLLLLLDPVFSFEPMERNPFEFSASVRKVDVVQERPPTPEPYSAPPVQSLAQNEGLLGKLKLGGVVYRDGTRYAYLLESGQGHFVALGSVIFDRYKVEDISVRSLLLKDLTSGAEARLFLSEM